MPGVAFDTLKLARKLESAGFPAKQAQDASAALADNFAEGQPKQKSMLKSPNAKLKSSAG